MEIFGLDGCRAGWVLASRQGVEVVTDLSEVIDRGGIVGIDMPIGLPTTAVRGTDALARRFLGGRAASRVFATAPRDVLAHPTYAAANAHSKRVHGRGISRQAFAIGPKITALDAVVHPGLEHRVVEIHPECAFAAMAGSTLITKHSPEGLRRRTELLATRFGVLPPTPPGASRDDVLDAYAVLWSAERFARGEHVVLTDGTRDRRGLLMRIVY